LQQFWRIAIPLALPALSAMAIFQIWWIWNDYAWPSLVANSTAARTVVSAVIFFNDGMYRPEPGAGMAAAVIAALPMVVLFVFTMRTFARPPGRQTVGSIRCRAKLRLARPQAPNRGLPFSDFVPDAGAGRRRRLRGTAALGVGAVLVYAKAGHLTLRHARRGTQCCPKTSSARYSPGCGASDYAYFESAGRARRAQPPQWCATAQPSCWRADDDPHGPVDLPVHQLALS
jgi:hypothetical protein